MELTVPLYQLDFSRKITSRDINRSTVEQKYAMYDYAIANKLFDQPSRFADETFGQFSVRLTRYKQAMLLFDDPTIYAYALLKWEGKPVRLYYFQDAIICDPHKRIDVESSNQLGKSFTLQVKTCVSFLKNHDKNWTIGLLSKSMAQNSMNMRAVRLMLQNAAVQYNPASNDNLTIVTREDPHTGFVNTIVCAVASTSALGYPFDELNLDEFEFWENPEGLEYMYKQILNPRTFATNGQIVIFSNPNGNNFVSENLQKARMKKRVGDQIIDTDELEFHTYNFNYLDHPKADLARWEQERATTHPIIFSSTMAAIRTDVQGAFFTDGEIRDSVSSELNEQGKYAGKGKQCFFFLDVGITYDQSVLVGCFLDKTPDEKKRANFFYVKAYPQTCPIWRILGVKPEDVKDSQFNINDGWSGSVESVRDILEEYRFNGNLPMFGIDVTGHAAIIPLCHAAGLSPIDITFSGPLKWGMYEQLKTFMAQRLLRRISDDNWIDGKNMHFAYQASRLVITKQQGGRYYLIHHENESDHDDIPDSFAGALKLANDYTMVIPTAKFFKNYKSANVLAKDNTIIDEPSMTT